MGLLVTAKHVLTLCQYSLNAMQRFYFQITRHVNNSTDDAGPS